MSASGSGDGGASGSGSDSRKVEDKGKAKVVEDNVEEKPVVAEHVPGSTIASTSASGVKRKKYVVEYESSFGGTYTMKFKKLKETVPYDSASYLRVQRELARKYEEERAQKLANDNDDLRECAGLYFAEMEYNCWADFDEEVEELVDAADAGPWMEELEALEEEEEEANEEEDADEEKDEDAFKPGSAFV